MRNKAMKIIDISHWQGNINWDKVEKSGVDVAIMKATQGVAMVDNKFAQNKSEARKEGLLCGFYHFADGGDYKKEADHFLKTVGDIREGEFLVLDFEINISNPAEWCKKWLDYVTEKIGFKPLLYSNEARIKSINFTEVAKANYGLWIAKYGDNDTIPEPNEIPNTDEWKFYAIWQFSSKGSVDGISGNVDLNTTTMDIDTMKKYGKPKSVEVTDYKKLYEEEKAKRVEAETVRDQYLEKIKFQNAVIQEIKKCSELIQAQLDKIKSLIN